MPLAAQAVTELDANEAPASDQRPQVFSRDRRSLAIHLPLGIPNRASLATSIRLHGGVLSPHVAKSDVVIIDTETYPHCQQSRQLFRSARGLPVPLPCVSASWITDSVKSGIAQNVNNPAYDVIRLLDELEKREARKVQTARNNDERQARLMRSELARNPQAAAIHAHSRLPGKLMYNAVDRYNIVEHLAITKATWCGRQVADELVATYGRHSRDSYQSFLRDNLDKGANLRAATERFKATGVNPIVVPPSLRLHNGHGPVGEAMQPTPAKSVAPRRSSPDDHGEFDGDDDDEEDPIVSSSNGAPRRRTQATVRKPRGYHPHGVRDVREGSFEEQDVSGASLREESQPRDEAETRESPKETRPEGAPEQTTPSHGFSDEEVGQLCTCVEIILKEILEANGLHVQDVEGDENFAVDVLRTEQDLQRGGTVWEGIAEVTDHGPDEWHDHFFEHIHHYVKLAKLALLTEWRRDSQSQMLTQTQLLTQTSGSHEALPADANGAASLVPDIDGASTPAQDKAAANGDRREKRPQATELQVDTEGDGQELLQSTLNAYQLEMSEEESDPTPAKGAEGGPDEGATTRARSPIDRTGRSADVEQQVEEALRSDGIAEQSGSAKRRQTGGALSDKAYDAETNAPVEVELSQPDARVQTLVLQDSFEDDIAEKHPFMEQPRRAGPSTPMAHRHHADAPRSHAGPSTSRPAPAPSRSRGGGEEGEDEVGDISALSQRARHHDHKALMRRQEELPGSEPASPTDAVAVEDALPAELPPLKARAKTYADAAVGQSQPFDGLDGARGADRQSRRAERHKQEAERQDRLEQLRIGIQERMLAGAGVSTKKNSTSRSFAPEDRRHPKHEELATESTPPRRTSSKAATGAWRAIRESSLDRDEEASGSRPRRVSRRRGSGRGYETEHGRYTGDEAESGTDSEYEVRGTRTDVEDDRPARRQARGAGTAERRAPRTSDIRRASASTSGGRRSTADKDVRATAARTTTRLAKRSRIPFLDFSRDLNSEGEDETEDDVVAHSRSNRTMPRWPAWVEERDVSRSNKRGRDSREKMRGTSREDTSMASTSERSSRLRLADASRTSERFSRLLPTDVSRPSERSSRLLPADTSRSISHGKLRQREDHSGREGRKEALKRRFQEKALQLARSYGLVDVSQLVPFLDKRNDLKAARRRLERHIDGIASEYGVERKVVVSLVKVERGSLRRAEEQLARIAAAGRKRMGDVDAEDLYEESGSVVSDDVAEDSFDEEVRIGSHDVDEYHDRRKRVRSRLSPTPVLLASSKRSRRSFV